MVKMKENNKDEEHEDNYRHPMLNVEAKNRKICSKPSKRHGLHRIRLEHGMAS